MELAEIETALNNPDFGQRLKAISALKDYDAEIAVPLLISRVEDEEFLVRSFVAMGLGKYKTDRAFSALLGMLHAERDTNVKAEAANSLSLFGEISIPHIVKEFYQEPNWLVRRTILAILADIGHPHHLHEVCCKALSDADATVREAAIRGLASLAGSSQHAAALEKLLELARSRSILMRIGAARALRHFKEAEAQEMLQQLRQDPDSKVVAATLENLLEK